MTTRQPASSADALRLTETTSTASRCQQLFINIFRHEVTACTSYMTVLRNSVIAICYFKSLYTSTKQERFYFIAVYCSNIAQCLIVMAWL